MDMFNGLTDIVSKEHMDGWACFERFMYAITLANKTHDTWLSECKQFLWPTNTTH